MSRKHFSLLLVVTLVVAAVVLLLPGRTGHESDITRSLFLPGLQSQVNDIDWLRIRGAGDAVIATLERGEDFWSLAESNDYRADWKRLRTLLADLAQSEIVEPKTANPDFYDRLGVEDVSAPGAGGVRIEFAESTGLPAVIVGNRAEGRSGRYVRLANVEESALIDRNLDVPASTEDWLDKAIVDIPDSEVVEVEIVHPGGERVSARKASADDEHFELQDIPEGREIRSAWTVDSLANALASLNLEAVKPETDLDWQGATQFSLVTADGLRVEVDAIAPATESGATDGSEETETDPAPPAAEHWVRVRAGLYQTALDSAVEAPEEGNEEEGADPAERAAEINRRVSGWAYRIPKYKFDSMTKGIEDLLQAKDDSDS